MRNPFLPIRELQKKGSRSNRKSTLAQTLRDWLSVKSQDNGAPLRHTTISFVPKSGQRQKI